MIEICEVDGLEAEKLSEKFGFGLNALQRVFVMREDGDIGVGVLQLDGGVVVVKHIVTDKPFVYYDLLARSLLDAVRDMRGVKIRIDKGVKPQQNGYFSGFGFKAGGEYLEALSDDIDLAGSCKNKAQKESAL